MEEPEALSKKKSKKNVQYFSKFKLSWGMQSKHQLETKLWRFSKARSRKAPFVNLNITESVSLIQLVRGLGPADCVQHY